MKIEIRPTINWFTLSKLSSAGTMDDQIENNAVASDQLRPQVGSVKCTLKFSENFCTPPAAQQVGCTDHSVLVVPGLCKVDNGLVALPRTSGVILAFSHMSLFTF